MIKDISSIIMKNFTIVNPCDGIQKIQNLISQKDHYYFPVVENNELIGILTYKGLLKAHPNRIAADAMSTHIMDIPINTPIWKAKDIFESKKEDVLLVKDTEKIIGFITKSFLYTEIGKHTDLLTGLYKSDYIYYRSIEMINKGLEISMIFLDVNNFGKIDKEYGHIKGDLILKEIGGILKENSPNETFICRFGGDEFVVLTLYPIDECVNLANNLLSAISKCHFINNVHVTVSAGISILKSENIKDKNINSIVYDFVNAASLASTKAKKNNCNLVVANMDEIA
jgi:diguanylate cyclase (GGDEF)-like protein